MPAKSNALVLDSWSVIAFLEDEPSAPRIADLIANAHDAEIPILMTVVNAGEVWYIIARELSPGEADKSIKELRDLRIQFEDVDWELTEEAARFKFRHKMSYADCFAAGLARARMADLVTGDKEFEAIQDEITIHWV